MHCKRHTVDLALAGRAVEQGQAGQESHAFAARRRQLFQCAFEAVRLAQDLFVKDGDLVGADDQVVRMLCSECLGFLPGKALYEVECGLVRSPAFIDIRRPAGEWQAQAGEQFAAV